MQKTIAVDIPPLITETLTSIWREVPILRQKGALIIPCGCYYGKEGNKLYVALRRTKHDLFIEGSQLTTELDKAIAYARGIHCAQPRSLLESEMTDNYYAYMRLK